MEQNKATEKAEKNAKFGPHPDFIRQYPQATTQVPKVPGQAFTPMISVCLGEAYERLIDATIDRPAETRRIPAATQEQLKWLFEQGNPHIVVIE